MEKMYQDYKDAAEFYIVYISEAHAADSSWPVPYAKDLGIKKHTDFGERCAVAERLVKEKKLTIPCLIDNMDNAVANAYQARPDRVYLVRKDGRLGVASGRGPFGFKPGVEAVAEWLADYREDGDEPALAEAGEDVGESSPAADKKDSPGFDELRRKLARTYRKADYAKALKVAQNMLEIRPEDSDCHYNVACLHCLLGDKNAAYQSLEKAIDAGYADAGHLRNDWDFKIIRAESRFRSLVKRLEQPAERTAARREKPSVFAGILGEWSMETSFNENTIEANMKLSVRDGALVGSWQSMGRDMELSDIEFDGEKLSFTRSMGGDRTLTFVGRVNGNRITGKYNGPFGELDCTGTRAKTSDASDTATQQVEAEPKYRGLLGPDNDKVRDVGSKTLLWASGELKVSGVPWTTNRGPPSPGPERANRFRSSKSPLR